MKLFQAVRSVDFDEHDHAVIDVPVSGQLERFGKRKTYEQPKFLVVQYRLVAGVNRPVARKLFEIPAGRKPRSMTIRLPHFPNE